GSIFYSRNGQFQVDKNGFIVNSQGHKVSGYLPNAAGMIVAAQPVPLQVNAADLTPKTSVNVAVGANLDSRSLGAGVGGAVPVTPVFNPLDPTSYNNSTSMTVYDSLGVNHVASLYFQRQPIAPTTTAAAIAAAANSTTLTSAAGMAVGNTITIAGAGPLGVPLTATISAIAGNVVSFSPSTSTAVAAGAAVTSNAASSNWNTYLTVDSNLVPAPVPPAAPTPLTTLTFDALGKLTGPAVPQLGVVTSAAFAPAGAALQPLTFNFSQTTQYGGNFGVNTLTQDGYASGRLNGFSTSQDGTVLGRYSNGQSRPLGQVLLANFTNPQGLQPVGNNEWAESAASGQPLIGTPGSSSLGVLQSSAVEDSNVDLTAELVNMITAQRVYQANAQTIKAQDQVLQTLVNLR
ncbi:MAG TPA: flagellar hook-basal body complex protein, partial [Gallionella sp.]|nr:flagellar hook-basal body complex protein [Gallionella sp.]